MAAVVGAIRDPVRRNNVKVAGQRSRLRAELSISSRSTSATVQAGRRVIYRVVVHNRGPATARGIVVTQALPAGFAVVDVRGARCQARIVVCQVVPLRKGRSRTITVVTTTAKPRTTATLSSVLSSTYDPRSVNDVAASRSD